MSTKKFDTVEEYWTEDDVEDAFQSANSSSIGFFERCLSNYLDTNNVHLIPSARWGLQWLLSNMGQRGKSGIVLAPSFNCEVVAEAIINSGNRLEGYDFVTENGKSCGTENRTLRDPTKDSCLR